MIDAKTARNKSDSINSNHTILEMIENKIVEASGIGKYFISIDTKHINETIVHHLITLGYKVERDCIYGYVPHYNISWG